MSDYPRGWFADWDDEATNEYGWQPCLETGQGHIPCFEVWFETRAACEEWIVANVIGVGWLPGEPTATPATAVPVVSDPSAPDPIDIELAGMVGHDEAGRNPHYNPGVVRVDTIDFGPDGSITRTTDEVPLGEWLHP